ncbi:MAG: arginine--tRNA ligase [Nitrospirae bacterium]|nr:arginine--tRNA ligase [Nitrospirota bacterium]
MREDLVNIIRDALGRARSEGAISMEAIPEISLEIPKRKGQGDFATTVAMTLSRTTGVPAREIAEIITRYITPLPSIIEGVEIAGPGFINITLKKSFWYRMLHEIIAAGNDYGQSNIGKGLQIQVEFVSANPTGPLHVGHGRGAAVGNAISNLLERVGYRVEREYYINDAGNQMKNLALSVYARYLNMLGSDQSFPEEGYKGTYVDDIARSIIDKEGRKYFDTPKEETFRIFSKIAYDQIMSGIKEDLTVAGIIFDSWFSESSLFAGKKVDESISELRSKGYIYEDEGAVWFRSSAFGDEKDRVVRKGDGEYTYLASDIAYHKNKLERGYDQIIDIWGADHHGYIPRMEAAIEAFGYPRKKLKIILSQMVNLVREGRPVQMSKRAGEFITLREVIDEVGPDAALYIFLTRRPDSHLDFDLEVAKKASDENPVYYIQYAHARLASLAREAEKRGIAVEGSNAPEPWNPGTLELLELPEELDIIKRLYLYPDIIEAAAEALEPHRLTIYLHDLSWSLHNYYYKQRIIDDNIEKTKARLMLMKTIKIVIADALKILGVTRPEKM